MRFTNDREQQTTVLECEPHTLELVPLADIQFVECGVDLGAWRGVLRREMMCPFCSRHAAQKGMSCLQPQHRGDQRHMHY